MIKKAYEILYEIWYRPKVVKDKLHSYPKIKRVETFERIDTIYNEDIYWTVKHDGSNIGLYLKNGKMELRSRGQEIAHIKFYNSMHATGFWDTCYEHLKIYEELFETRYILYGELMPKGRRGSGRIVGEKDEFILFDVYDRDKKEFLPYNRVYQIAYDIGVPCTECVMVSNINNYDDYLKVRNEILSHPTIVNEEGAVGKVYKGDSHIFIKEKHNIAPPAKTFKSKPFDAEQLPRLPDDEIVNILATMRDEMDESDFRNIKVAMPEFAKRIGLECKGHGYSSPKQKLVKYYYAFLEEMFKDD